MDKGFFFNSLKIVFHLIFKESFVDVFTFFDGFVFVFLDEVPDR